MLSGGPNRVGQGRPGVLDGREASWAEIKEVNCLQRGGIIVSFAALVCWDTKVKIGAAS